MNLGRGTLLFARVVLGLVFIYAGIVKLGNLPRFAGDIAAFELISGSAVTLLTLSLPWFEILVGAMLVTGIGIGPAALGVVGLMLVFLLALAQASLRGLEVECGCFGETPQGAGTFTALRDFLILAVAAAVYANNISPVCHRRASQ